MKTLLSRLVIFASLASTSYAFLSPCVSQGVCTSTSATWFSTRNTNLRKFDIESNLRQSSTDDDIDSSNTINIAIFSTNNYFSFEQALLNHPFCKMTGVTLSIDWIATNKEASWTKSELDIVQATDIACFSTISSVKTYLSKLDNHLNVDPQLPQEERRKLPNKPDLVADIIGTQGNRDLVAACPLTETARECLNSGRWMANNIYYPKDGQAVELKTESLEESYQDDGGDDDVDIDVDVWADSVLQAAGDVLERKFWGGGW